jgi:hypothetical protein
VVCSVIRPLAYHKDGVEGQRATVLQLPAAARPEAVKGQATPDVHELGREQRHRHVETEYRPLRCDRACDQRQGVQCEAM